MVKLVNYLLRTADGFEVDIDCRCTDDGAVKIPVIFCHGFKGFKDWGGFPYMMERLAGKGFFAVSFNFSHNGVSHETPLDFTRLDLFAENTISRELDELGFVIDNLGSITGEAKVDMNRLSLIGHSRGGGTAILHAAADSRIRKLVTLASVSGFARYGKEQIRRWRETGYTEIENSRTGQMMRMNASILEDIENNPGRLNIKKAAAEIKVPFLIIHGSEDLAVKPDEAGEIYSAADKSLSELYIIDKTGHTFGVVHPFGGTTDAFEKVIDKTAEFLK